MSKHQLIVDGSVHWFNKFNSPSEKFRKSELEASALLNHLEDRSARNHKKMDIVWTQKFSANFGKIRGQEVPDRTASQPTIIKSAKKIPGLDNTLPSVQMSSSGGMPAWAAQRMAGLMVPSTPENKPMLQLQTPEKRPDTTGGQRLSGSSTHTPFDWSLKSADMEIGELRSPIHSLGSPMRSTFSNSGEFARFRRQGPDMSLYQPPTPLYRASSAPMVGCGSLSGMSPKSAPPTSNSRYGWNELPPHMAVKPRTIPQAEEVTYTESCIKSGTRYNPSIRF